MYTWEEIANIIARTPAQMRGRTVKELPKRSICTARRKNPITKRLMTIYTVWGKDESFNLIVENGKVL